MCLLSYGSAAGCEAVAVPRRKLAITLGLRPGLGFAPSVFLVNKQKG